MEKKLLTDIASLLNKHSIDAELGIPDFILAESVKDHLLSLKKLEKERRRWFDETSSRPG